MIKLERNILARQRKYWLMKSEPDVFSIQDLKACKVTCWDGVRNYQARNYMRDEMRIGDRVLFYHSSSNPTGIAGIAEVVKESYPDYTAFDPRDVHYDPKSDLKKPTWYMVDVKFVKAFKSVIPLSVLRKAPGLKNMLLLRHGRLSVQPVKTKEWETILRIELKT